MKQQYVIIVAGGKGLRMGGELPKQFIPVCGRPVLMRTLQAFYAANPAMRIILVLPASHQEYWRMLCREIGCSIPHTLVAGGETRFHSVQNGLLAVEQQLKEQRLSPEDVLVGIHDGVRPFVSEAVIHACFDAAEKRGAVVPVLPMIDSLRERDEKGSHPVDRSCFMAVQTPQVFQYPLIRSGYDQSFNELFTDDASVVETQGCKIHTVEGNRENIKITTPFDLLIAEAWCNLH